MSTKINRNQLPDIWHMAISAREKFDQANSGIKPQKSKRGNKVEQSGSLHKVATLRNFIHNLPAKYQVKKPVQSKPKRMGFVRQVKNWDAPKSNSSTMQKTNHLIRSSGMENLAGQRKKQSTLEEELAIEREMLSWLGTQSSSSNSSSSMPTTSTKTPIHTKALSQSVENDDEAGEAPDFEELS